MTDPRLSVMPDFASEAFRVARQAIMATTDSTEGGAISLLRQGWELDLQAKVTQWQGQQAYRAQQRGQEPQEQGQQRRQQRQQAPQGQQEQQEQQGQGQQRQEQQQQGQPAGQAEQQQGAQQVQQQVPDVPQQPEEGDIPQTLPTGQGLPDLPRVEEAVDSGSPKKKTKLRDFEDNSVVRTTPAAGRPSKFALKKLADFEYVELYYFTVEACREAAEHERTVAEEAFTLSKVDDTMALKPIGAYKSSSKAVPDSRLTWNEVSIAKTKLLQAMQDAQWPAKHLVALAGFFVNLDAHEIREEEEGELALVQYQAEVRREWMDALTGSGSQKPFDISVINEERLRRIAAKILHQRQLVSVQRYDSNIEISLRLNICFSLRPFHLTSRCSWHLHHTCTTPAPHPHLASSHAAAPHAWLLHQDGTKVRPDVSRG